MSSSRRHLDFQTKVNEWHRRGLWVHLLANRGDSTIAQVTLVMPHSLRAGTSYPPSSSVYANVKRSEASLLPLILSSIMTLAPATMGRWLRWLHLRRAFTTSKISEKLPVLRLGSQSGFAPLTPRAHILTALPSPLLVCRLCGL
jgi:hypothetical protein